MTRKYPLSSLESLREREVATREAELAEALLAAKRAKTRAEEAKAAREHFEATSDAQRREIQAHLESGAARVADLAQATAWRQGQAHEGRAHEAREVTAEEAANSKQGALQSAQRNLGDARIQEKAVKQHHAAWRESGRRKAEAAEEEAVEDAWASKHRRRG